MLYRNLLSFFLFVVSVAAYGQKGLQFSPEKPKAGEPITITYELSGDLANTTSPLEAVAHLSGFKAGEVAQELALIKEGNKYKATIKTDTSHNFIYLTFIAGNEIDDNSKQGYWIRLYDGDKVKKGANAAVSSFYSYNSVGAKASDEQLVQYLNQEIALYPEQKKKYLYLQLSYQARINKKEAPAILQKGIEDLLKEGLKTEDDYSLLGNLYNAAGLPRQSKMVDALKKQLFPNGAWTVAEEERKFYMDQDPVKKEQLLAGMMKKAETDEKWKEKMKGIGNYQGAIAYAYLGKGDWEGLKMSIAKYQLSQDVVANMYNTAAWKIYESAGLDTVKKYGREFADFAATWSKAEWKKPAAKKRDDMTQKQWDQKRAANYAAYADTYAAVLYRLGEYKKGFDYSNDAALIINKGEQANMNNTYALLAEHAVPVKKYTKQLEQFVKEAKATDSVYAILKRAYLQHKGTVDGFDDYIASLQHENYKKKLEELRGSILNETAPSFAVFDLTGNKVDLAALKGKVVVLDFWATWCGPCIASFPAMQKMVRKYKDSAHVTFLFIDTYERVPEKKKKVGDFISSKKFTDFQVLLDDDNKVADQYNVKNIPQKFVIDKNGVIRFRAIGFGGGDDGLVSELSAMIALAKESSK